MRSTCRRSGGRLRSAGSVSGSPSAETTSSSTPKQASTRNTPGHDVQRSTCPPITGASIGPRPLTSISIEKNRAISVPEYRSRTAALAITMPAAALTPWANRSAASAYTDGATAHTSELTV
ncbi:hypothetical protein BJP25_05360 [Actinokineospora bangkokensis]|uniref:Uncharacterized protein n=1 Tax=Actinokineospora bangkokensis TaxID=1193682 RepID=A0A1Q9LBW7_9PSEU|nr:hypothetical protein BJP25_05360 [Actinokineospora bangkokensis]